jgi:hypothetical protein
MSVFAGETDRIATIRLRPCCVMDRATADAQQCVRVRLPEPTANDVIYLVAAAATRASTVIFIEPR